MITGDRIRLRPMERDDMPLVAKWRSDPDVNATLGARYQRSTESMERQFGNAWEQPAHFANVNFMIETLDGRAIGHTGLHGAAGETRVAEFGILIGEKDCWSSGYGTDATRTLLRYAFEQMNLHKVDLGANADNARGIRCYEKAGFVLEGTRRQCAWRGGRWLDRVVMSVLREDWERSRA